ncbi:MAG: hypothetical protein A2Y10_11075 [Planctomycetes bacterium GWF2_41_51]|nr:MAG: hypothetical protein A2Y10_11075 [Planctomycetes bacterium GWF2_41_51]HBG28409.1 hypothetical protein [Phycisphaerales bacterium]
MDDPWIYFFIWILICTILICVYFIRRIIILSNVKVNGNKIIKEALRPRVKILTTKIPNKKKSLQPKYRKKSEG